jgi:hypothetical protein
VIDRFRLPDDPAADGSFGPLTRLVQVVEEGFVFCGVRHVRVP